MLQAFASPVLFVSWVPNHTHLCWTRNTWSALSAESLCVKVQFSILTDKAMEEGSVHTHGQHHIGVANGAL